MKTALFSHTDCLKHVEIPGHAEQRARLGAVLDAVRAADLDLVEHDAPLASRDDVLRVHDADYVKRVLDQGPDEGWTQLDPDTAQSPGSAKAALRAAGAVIAAVDGVMAGEYARAFCAVRPPGHHARPGSAMGFCLFNSVAIAAKYARDVHGLKRVAVVDFDVHHGNGTQEMFWDEDGLFYASIHQSGFYPGTGREDERGAKGRIINVPLPAGTDGTPWRHAYQRHIHTALEDFAPELVLLSAGFDAHKDDPLAQFNLGCDDFVWITEQLLTLARETARGRVVSVLEGGYDLAALGRCSVAHVTALGAV
ncbi:MAG: acetoin utilization protein [Robiginitomaculum sp.]|nr:MAG: acetoin utilization protein [Robiginitomaculum sp.]